MLACRMESVKANERQRPRKPRQASRLALPFQLVPGAERCHRVLARRLAALDPGARRAAPARQHLSRAQRSARRRTCSASSSRWCATAARWRGRSTMGWSASCRRRARSIDPAKPPFVVVDPRAGHGPGIGGMKQDSEIGVALAAGHPCYFIGFLPEPVPGQTIEDVCAAEAALHRGGGGAPSRGGGQARHRRQLPGRLADHDDGRHQPDIVGPDPARRLAAVATGPACAAAIRCAISAACWAAPG